MDPIQNPYRPGAGVKPTTLAGRDEVISKAIVLLKRVKNGEPQRSLMLYGLRGVGKTVLLNTFEFIAEDERYIVEHLEMSENDDFKKVIARTLRKILLKIDSIEKAKSGLLKAFKVLKAFSIALPDGPEIKIDVDAIVGEGDSGNFESDLVDLIVNLGTAASENRKFICILIDETQYLNQESYASLIAASHRISQKSLPVVFICAGLPQIAALSGDAKSYAERLYEYISIANLPLKEAELAIIEPAKNKGIIYNQDAVAELIKITEGYPYFIQEFAKNVWDIAQNNPITIADVESAKGITTVALDNSFFKVRLDRATTTEKKLMKGMASFGKGPYRMSDVAQKLKMRMASLSLTRATLIRKGFVYSPQHGQIDFTVPHFDDFLRRYFNLNRLP
jgi:hypothetical protein